MGKVLSKESHPEADRLSVCSVQIMPDQPPANIVCGATNYKVGDCVPVALPGALLPDRFKIKKSKLRGGFSEGMMCSALELELGVITKGCVLADKPFSPGTPIKTLFSNEVTLELENYGKPGRCLSHNGVAREIAGYYNKD